MKKGDEIQMREDIAKGKSLMHGFTSLDKATYALGSIDKFYNLPESVELECGYDDLNPGLFAIMAKEDTYIIVEATVNWVVDNEVSIKFKDSGASKIIDINDAENQGWIVIKSAAPTYQSDVEHMSDEELRASIESLRATRVARPPTIRKASTRVKEAPMSKEDKQLSGVLSNMDPKAKLALQKKLGLI